MGTTKTIAIAGLIKDAASFERLWETIEASSLTCLDPNQSIDDRGEFVELLQMGRRLGFYRSDTNADLSELREVCRRIGLDYAYAAEPDSEYSGSREFFAPSLGLTKPITVAGTDGSADVATIRNLMKAGSEKELKDYLHLCERGEGAIAKSFSTSDAVLAEIEAADGPRP